MKLWRPFYEYLSMRPTKFGELSLGIGKMPSQPASTTTSKSQLLWDPLFTPDLSTFLIGKIKLKLS
jgi:hypothetical protein